MSAQQARERKKVYLTDLESRSKDLEDKNAELEEKVATLQRENFMLRQVNFKGNWLSLRGCGYSTLEISTDLFCFLSLQIVKNTALKRPAEETL